MPLESEGHRKENEKDGFGQERDPMDDKQQQVGRTAESDLCKQMARVQQVA